MAPIDEICGCSYETHNSFCLCVNRKDQARGECIDCLSGKHQMEIKHTFSVGDTKL